MRPPNSTSRVHERINVLVFMNKAVVRCNAPLVRLQHARSALPVLLGAERGGGVLTCGLLWSEV